MAQPTVLLDFLAVVMLLFIIVFVIMFIDYKRLGRRWRREEQRKRTEPVVGTDRGPTSGPQQIHYRSTDNPMDQDIGGNLARIPRQEQDTNDDLHKR